MSDALRPRFRYYVPNSQEDLKEVFKASFSDSEQTDFMGSALKYHITIDYTLKNRHFWSPHLDLNLEPYKEGTLIRGLIGPRPNVWTIFMFFNSVGVFLGVVGLIVGTGQWSMSNIPYAYWMLPLSGLILIIIYYLGKTGKRIAHEESVRLHSFFTGHLKDFKEVQLDEL